MAAPSKAQLRAELAQMSALLKPITDEYLDGYFVIGQRAPVGDAKDVVLHFTTANSRAKMEKVENLVLWYAAEILERRKRAAKRPRRR